MIRVTRYKNRKYHVKGQGYVRLADLVNAFEHHGAEVLILDKLSGLDITREAFAGQARKEIKAGRLVIRLAEKIKGDKKL